MRLTGSHASFEPSAAEEWLRTRQHHHDRADWAVLRNDDHRFLGEAVLNDLDVHNAAVNYRVWLAGPGAMGLGYGTEATRLAVPYALDDIGLNRVSLGVFDFNHRAGRPMRSAGFKKRAACARLCAGTGSGTTRS